MFQVHLNKSEFEGDYVCYNKIEADSMDVKYVIPPFTEKDADGISYVLTANNYVIPLLDIYSNGIKSYYSTPYGTTELKNLLYCSCSPKGTLHESRKSLLKNTKLRSMAKWAAQVGDASIAYRMAFGHKPDEDTLDSIIALPEYQELVRNELVYSQDSLIPLREIIQLRMRHLIGMEEVLDTVKERITANPEWTPSDLDNYLRTANAQMSNIIDVETGYIRRAPEGADFTKEVEMRWSLKGREMAHRLLPKSKNPEEVMGNIHEGESAPELPPEFELVEFHSEENNNGKTEETNETGTDSGDSGSDS